MGLRCSVCKLKMQNNVMVLWQIATGRQDKVLLVKCNKTIQCGKHVLSIQKHTAFLASMS